VVDRGSGSSFPTVLASSITNSRRKLRRGVGIVSLRLNRHVSLNDDEISQSSPSTRREGPEVVSEFDVALTASAN